MYMSYGIEYSAITLPYVILCGGVSVCISVVSLHSCHSLKLYNEKTKYPMRAYRQRQKDKGITSATKLTTRKQVVKRENTGDLRKGNKDQNYQVRTCAEKMKKEGQTMQRRN